MIASHRAALEQMRPGVYTDRRGTFHLDVPALLARYDLVDTPAMRRHYARRVCSCFREEQLEGLIVAHLRGLPTH